MSSYVSSCCKFTIVARLPDQSLANNLKHVLIIYDFCFVYFVPQVDDVINSFDH